MKTFKELWDLDNVVGGMYQENPELKEGRFAYGYKRFAEGNFYPMLKEYNLELSDLRIDNALVDEKTKALLIENSPRGFQYGKSELKTVIHAENDLIIKFNLKEIEIKKYILKQEDIPVELPVEYHEFFLEDVK